MSVTLTNIKRVVAGNSLRVCGTVTGPASYTTGGETLTATQIRQLTGNQSATSLASVFSFDPDSSDATNFRTLVLDKTNLKMLFVAGATQVASTTNLSAVSLNFEALVQIVNG
jgi:hypothetical protein